MPFRHDVYDSPYTGTIADLMGRQSSIRANAAREAGHARARAAEIRGQSTANTIGSIGHAATQAIGTIGQMAQDRRNAPLVAQERDLAIRERLAKIAEIEDKLRTSQANRDEADAAKAAVQTAMQDAGGDHAKAAELLRAGGWVTLAGQIVSQLPKPSLHNVPAGTSVIDESNPSAGPVFTAPAREPAPPAVGSFEDFVVRKYGPKPTPDQITQARKDYQQADDRPYAPTIVVTGAGPQLVDRGSGTARPITDAGGSVVGPTPTEQQRNEARQYSKARPILSALSELSEKINTQQGAMAKISGAAELQKAKINLNDDVAEYESVISGFTPLIARALGHVGILTEQDVQSVKAMFPRPGDSKSLRDRKIARIEQLMGAMEGAPAAAPPAASDPYEEYLRRQRPQ